MSWTANPVDQFSIAIKIQQDVNSSEGTHPLLDFVIRYAFYAALTAIFLMVMALIVKLMWNCEEGSGEGARADESSRLIFSSKDDKAMSYGIVGDDAESDSCTSSSDDLYDGKICVICYDHQRDCFFIPCGHCVACHTCAVRIINDDSKSCPICRGIIDKVRRLHIV